MKQAMYLSVLAGGAILSAAMGLSGCVKNATTGRSQYEYYSPSEEVALGLQAKPEMLKEYGGEYPNTEIKTYVNEVGAKLAAQTEAENPKLPWGFTVLDSDIINAFALPGGQVFISKGLLKQMTNEAQLAGVLGHEVGHVCARHTNDRMVDQAGVGIAATVGAAVLSEGVGGELGAMAPKVLEFGGQSLVLSYGRDQEIEADRLGMRYMSRAMYNPLAQRQVMEILETAMKGATGQQAEWLSTHPYPKTRIRIIDQHLSGTYAKMKDDPRYVFNEEQFKARCASKLSVGESGEGPRLAAAGKYGWCAVCAANARQ
ncbi:MAG: M48 family metalloprotease [Planctomycetes bacterium]|nr:M48 family metalloprotease [Planctomycetota bacterium]